MTAVSVVLALVKVASVPTDSSALPPETSLTVPAEFITIGFASVIAPEAVALT